MGDNSSSAVQLFARESSCFGADGWDAAYMYCEGAKQVAPHLKVAFPLMMGQRKSPSRHTYCDPRQYREIRK